MQSTRTTPTDNILDVDVDDDQDCRSEQGMKVTKSRKRRRPDVLCVEFLKSFQLRNGWLLVLFAFLSLKGWYRTPRSSIVSIDRFVPLVQALVSPCHHSVTRKSVQYWHSIRDARQPPTDVTACYAKASKGELPDKDKHAATKQTRRRQSAPQILTCSSTNELMEACQHCLRPGDVVAELGAQLRTVSRTICEMIGTNDNDKGRAIMVDVIRKFPKSAEPTNKPNDPRTKAMRRPMDHLDFDTEYTTFVEIPSFADWRQTLWNSTVTKTDQALDYTVLVLDANAMVGNDLPWTSLSTIMDFVAMASTGSLRTILVKSLALNQFASQLHHGQRWLYYQQQKAQADVEGNDAFDSSATTQIIATVGVDEYRKTIPYLVQPSDTVLEVGCHLGTTTNLIHDQVAESLSRSMTSERKVPLVMGVDVGPKIIQGAQQKYPHLFFAVGNAWKTAELLRLQQDFYHQADISVRQRRIGFDVVYVDVGGLSGADGLLETLTLLSSYTYALEPRWIVVKSLCLRRLASSLTPYWRVQRVASQSNKDEVDDP